MKRDDIICFVIILAVFLPFFLFAPAKEFFFEMTASHGMIMSFFKFAILATFGESIGLRISKGCYNYKGFGLMPRAIVWGILGMGINAAIIIFSTGVPVLLEYCGLNGAVEAYKATEMSWMKLGTAFAVSVSMNSIFAPVFMTLHKITDTHILENGGRVGALLKPIPFGRIMSGLNWNVQWGFVFKKTIPLFWFPAHTITFILPPSLRVLCAALLGVFLGIILAIAARK